MAGLEKAGELEKTDHQESRDVIKARYAADQADKSLKHIQRWTRSTAFYTCRRLYLNLMYLKCFKEIEASPRLH
jgi:hypothetical protein